MSGAPSPTRSSSPRAAGCTRRRSPPRPPLSRRACSRRYASCSRPPAARADQVRRFAHGMTVATNALLGGEHRPHRAAHDGGLRGRDRARPPEPRPTCTGSARRLPPPLVAAAAALGVHERVDPGGRPGGAGARPRARARGGAGGRRHAGGGGVPAALLRATPSTSGCSASRSASCSRTWRCRSRASSWAPSASTSARPPPPSTPRSPHCCPPTWGGSPREADARTACPSPQIMQSSGGLTDAASAGAPRRADGAVGPRRRRRGRLAAGRAGGRASRAVPGHGGHLL